MMKLRPQKRIRSSEDDSDSDRDRLSEMPDDVIVRILSCMPTIDAVRTVLLRRFGDRWTLIRTLEFDMSEFRSNFCQKEKFHLGMFYRFIRNVLMLHQNRSIDRFQLCVEFHSDEERDEAADDIRIWFRFAFGKQAKEIRLSDNSTYHSTCTTILPKFKSEFLVTLLLDHCRFKGKVLVNLVSLKKLSLEHVTMSKKFFESFISGCPSLQELVVVNPCGMKKLSFSAPNIEKLSLAFTEEYHWDLPVLINAPNLKSLYLEIDIGQVETINVSSLSDIYIYYYTYPFYDNDLIEINKMIFGRFPSTEVLRLSVGASKLFLHEIQDLQVLQNRWKRIVLELHDMCESCLSGICYLLRTSKHLEELTIYTNEEGEKLEFIKHVSNFPRPKGLAKCQVNFCLTRIPFCFCPCPKRR